MPTPPQAASPAAGDPAPSGQTDPASRYRSQLSALASRLEQANIDVRDPDIVDIYIDVARELRSISGCKSPDRLYPTEVQRKLDLPIRQCAILLIHLLSTSGTVQTHETLANALSVKAEKPNVVKVYIHSLRAALAKHSQIALIQTHYGRGYMIPPVYAALIRRLLD
jgi:hypothetical protein